jgi:hypothetical protein
LKSGEPIILMICDLTMPAKGGLAFLADQESGQLLREFRVLQGARVVMKQEQARFKSSSKAGNHYSPMARGIIWKQNAHHSAETVSK